MLEEKTKNELISDEEFENAVNNPISLDESKKEEFPNEVNTEYEFRKTKDLKIDESLLSEEQLEETKVKLPVPWLLIGIIIIFVLMIVCIIVIVYLQGEVDPDSSGNNLIKLFK